MNELACFEIEWGKFMAMLDDIGATSEDYYKMFSDMCTNYDNESAVPYSVCHALIDDEFPCEENYMQMLMDVYADFNIGDDFLDLLQQLIDEGYCIRYQKKAHELIKEYIKNGYVIAYRGEFAKGMEGNLDYRQSVSYSLDYEEAKFFATRYNMLNLPKSIVYTVKVPVEDVFAYIEKENEVVCLPICMGGKMEVIKEDSFL